MLWSIFFLFFIIKYTFFNLIKQNFFFVCHEVWIITGNAIYGPSWAQWSNRTVPDNLHWFICYTWKQEFVQQFYLIWFYLLSNCRHNFPCMWIFYKHPFPCTHTPSQKYIQKCKCNFWTQTMKCIHSLVWDQKHLSNNFWTLPIAYYTCNATGQTNPTLTLCKFARLEAVDSIFFHKSDEFWLPKL